MKKLPKRDGIRHEPRQPQRSTEAIMRSALAHAIRLTIANMEETEGTAFPGNTRGRKGYARISIAVPFGAD